MKNIEDLNILVVGDVMIDRYIGGTVERISQEAPVPIVLVTEEYETLGGAGNVARNIATLGAHVEFFGSCGNDPDALKVLGMLRELKIGYNLVYESPVTIVKERIVAGERKTQMLRIDRERPLSINPDKVIERLQGVNKKFDIIIVSDYNKGLISFEIMEYMRSIYFDIPIIVDPKPSNISKYGKVFLMTPNQKEWYTILANSSCKPEAEYYLVTKGKDGMDLIDARDPDRNRWITTKIPSQPVSIFNPSGAGDTAVSIFSVCYALGLDLELSAKIANDCAAYVVTQPSTAIVPNNIFSKIYKKWLDRYNPSNESLLPLYK
jgi:D-glycero-beta-D-manno-heptose-7-phosphate kinase